MFEQAFAAAAEVSSDENWTRLQKYEEKEYYSATDVEINLNERTIGDLSGNVSTLGEDNSQYIQFIMDRYADGVDLTTMLIQVQYKLEDGQESVSAPVNAYASESRIRFGWPISRIATQKAQTIQFIVFCTGNRQDGETYVLKTKPIKYKIEFTLGIGGTIIAPDEDWFLQFENVMNEKMNQVATLTEDAIDSAAGAKESEQNAAQSASTASTLASQVQSNTAQAKASADAAKVSEQNAKASEDAARVYAGNASAVANVQIGTSDTAGLLRGGDIHVDESGALKMITTTTETTMPNSHDGRLLVEEIGGVCEQKQYTGKNVLENTTLKNVATSYGVTFTPNADGSITVNGTPSQWFPQAINQKLLLTSGTEYVLSGCPSGGGYYTYYMYIEIKTSDGGSIVHRDEGNGVTFTYPTNAISAFIAIALNENVAVSNLQYKPMIRLASITDPTYEPYTGGIPSPNPSYPQEIKKSVVSGVKTHGGKNMFDKSILSNAQHGVTSYVKIKAKPNTTYVFSSNIPKSFGGGHAYVFMYTTYGGEATSVNGVWEGQTRTARTSDDGIVTVAYRSDNDNISDLTKYWYQLEEGTVATSYEPYKGTSITLSNPIDLYGIGDVQDVITPKNVDRRFVKISNYDTFTISPYGNKEKHYGYVLIPSGSANFETGGKILCSHLPLIDSGSHYKGSEIGVTLYPTAIGICVDIPTTTEVKSWLIDNGVEFICQTATETTESLPTADQIALNSLATYDGITYLEFDSEVQPTFEGEYGTSKVGGYTLESLLTARNNKLEIEAMKAVQATSEE